MIILVFDTETTGLPETKIINPDTLNLWPNIVQLSYIVYDVSKNVILNVTDAIVKLEDDNIISEESTKIHGITNEMSQNSGLEIEMLITEMFQYLRKVDLIVGHNVSFDINVLMVELLRLIYFKKDNMIQSDLIRYKHYLHFITNVKNVCCTMKLAKDLCQIKAISKLGNEYLKFPKLIELHEKLFVEKPKNLHNSLNDIMVTLRCFCKLAYEIDLYDRSKDYKQMSKKIKLY
jgi:DNA polymerase III epsilon subunit-like protein